MRIKIKTTIPMPHGNYYEGKEYETSDKLTEHIAKSMIASGDAVEVKVIKVEHANAKAEGAENTAGKLPETRKRPGKDDPDYIKGADDDDKDTGKENKNKK